MHQDLQQILTADSALANSVITNPATRICFALGDFDAQKLQSGFVHFDANDLMNLGVGEAIVRIERNEYDFNLLTYDVPSVAADVTSMRKDKIIALTRERYGQKTPTLEVQDRTGERKEEQIPVVEVKPVPIVTVEYKTAHKPKPTSQTQEVAVPFDDLRKA